jgi:hypothetical protein
MILKNNIIFLLLITISSLAQSITLDCKISCSDKVTRYVFLEGWKTEFKNLKVVSVQKLYTSQFNENLVLCTERCSHLASRYNNRTSKINNTYKNYRCIGELFYSQSSGN